MHIQLINNQHAEVKLIKCVEATYHTNVSIVQLYFIMLCFVVWFPYQNCLLKTVNFYLLVYQ